MYLQIEIYEDVAVRSMDNNLLKFSAKGYLLNAGICRLCGESLKLAPEVSDTRCQWPHREGVSLRAWQQTVLVQQLVPPELCMLLKSVHCKASRRTQHCCSAP